MVKSAISSLVGEEATPSYQKTWFESLPKQVQDTYLKDFLPHAKELYGNEQNFAATNLTPAQKQALERMKGGAPTPAFNFDFGKKADAAFGKANGLIDTAQNYTSQGAAPITSGEIQSSYDDFFNPYTQDVVNATSNDVNSQLDKDLSRIRSSSRAFGGSALGVQQGIVASEATKNLGDLTSRLRASGYESAMGRGMDRLTGDRGRLLQAGQDTNAQAGTATNLGANYWDSRMGVNDLVQSAKDNYRTDTGDMLAAGTTYQNLNRERQETPFRQLQFLMEQLAAFQGGGGSTGGVAATQGLIGGGGMINGGGTVQENASRAAGYR